MEMFPDRCLTGNTNFVGDHCWIRASFHNFRTWANCALCALDAKKTGAVSLFQFGLRSELSGSDCCETIDGPEHASSQGGFCYD